MSKAKALNLIKRGRAIWLPDGRILITDEERMRLMQIETRMERLCQLEERIEEEREFQRNRAGIVYWNGARAAYENGRDVAMFPPGCNVTFPKVGTARAARRYCR